MLRFAAVAIDPYNNKGIEWGYGFEMGILSNKVSVMLDKENIT